MTGINTPALDAESGLSGPGANFLQGPGGREKRGFANFAPTFGNFGATGGGWGAFGGYSYGSGGPWNNLAHRDRNVASTISNELAVSATSIRTLIDVLTSATVGPEGLTLSAKVDAEKIGLTDPQAREINRQLENLWKTWTENPDHCDISGRFDFHSLATQSFHSYLLSGESLSFVDVSRVPGVPTLTKCAMSDPRIIDLTSKTVPGGYVFQGMQYSVVGRWEGIWARRIPLGAITNPGALQYIPAKTRWGRPKTVHLFSAIVPNQVRGASPLLNALANVASHELLQELSIAAHAAQLNWALTLESDAPSNVALGGLEVPHEPAALGEALAGAMVDMRADWYNGGANTPELRTEGGAVARLLPGDKLKMTQPAKLADNFESFNRSLQLGIARSAGAAGSSVTGDFSQINFSASKMEAHEPAMKALQRRREIVAKFYATYYRAFVEEVFAQGMIELPEGITNFFWDMPQAYCRASFLGRGAPEPDKLKQAQATVLRLANGLDTLADVLASEGKDFDSHLIQLQREHAALKAAGLPIEYTTSSVRKIQEDEEAGGNEEAPEGAQQKGDEP